MDQEQTVSIVLDSADPVATQPPVRWAAQELVQALEGQGASVRVTDSLEADGEGMCVVIGSERSSVVRERLNGTGIALPEEPEVLALVPATAGGRLVVLTTGSDVRGLVYATLELADRVRCAVDGTAARAALRVEAPVLEQPANRIRSVMRLFTSDVEDLGWYHDRGFWREYLSEMVAQRFNRFHLALGIGFDFARRIRDTYFYFPYPFLLAVPRYAVRTTNVTEAEQVRNLATLRFIAAEAKRRGLHFQLGIWANVYEFEDSPEANHQIEGLTPEIHAPYCRDALRMLLQEVPDIDGVTLRIHGESGVPEGSYDFWRTLLSGIATCGRRVEIDMHAKGIDQRMIKLGLETGQPLLVSPKFWAEHLGLPYHQAEIRAQEQPGEPSGQHARLMALSVGSRRFTRYGYADLLNRDRKHGVLFRIWPGTNRLLLWGDPATGRGYGHTFSFGGADGVEVFEPLSFSGRRGSGLVDGRNPYTDDTLRPEGPHGEWKKYLYEYRLWGRLTYNPEAEAEQWRRYVRQQFGEAAPAMEAALGSASRILPLVTTAHHPSAANNA
ncbi:MAG TPA: hypothetical protein VGW38_21525, partial [Chloroflexota bacterium]|nr:hypothetical protein [Chloroflexota bacterium]